jgi:hypothetical protein
MEIVASRNKNNATFPGNRNIVELAVHLTLFIKVLAGLKDGILCAGIIIEVFFDVFLAVFSALLTFYYKTTKSS